MEELTRHTKSRTLLELLPELSGDGEERPGRYGLESERRVGLVEWLAESDRDSSWDGMICLDGFEALPVCDIPWLVDALFEKASRFVFVAVRCPESSPRRRFLLPPQGTTHTPEWWRSHFEAASSRHPEISWALMTARGAAFEPNRIHVRRGGPRSESTPPHVWTLTDGEPGNETQAAALVSSLGWPSTVLMPALGPMADLPFADRGAHLRSLRAMGDGLASAQTPWPDLLIVAGRRVAPMARWVRRESRGRTLVVAIGAKTATPAGSVDLAVTRKGVALFSHPHLFEIDRPLVSAVHSGPTSARWQARVAAIRGPRIALLLGSGT